MEDLFDEHPFLAAIAIRSAEGYAVAGDRDGAKKMIERAVAAGWRSATYLRESESLSPLLIEPEIASLMTRLSDLPTFMQPPVGFAAVRGWTSSGHRTAEPGQAIAYLTSRSSRSSYGDRTVLMEAFEKTVSQVAKSVVAEVLADNDKFKEAVRKLTNDALDTWLENANPDLIAAATKGILKAISDTSRW